MFSQYQIDGIYSSLLSILGNNDTTFENGAFYLHLDGKKNYQAWCQISHVRKEPDQMCHLAF